MRWPLCFRRTLERERHRCADAINSAIYWRQNYDNSSKVGYARGIALERVIKEWKGDALSLEEIAVGIAVTGQATREIRELAASEIQRMIPTTAGEVRE